MKKLVILLFALLSLVMAKANETMPEGHQREMVGVIKADAYGGHKQ